MADNPALTWAASQGKVAPIYIQDDQTTEFRALGGAQNWWLHHSLTSLDRSIRDRGGRLIVRRGDAATLIDQLVDELGATAVAWNRLYTKSAITRDTAIKSALTARGLQTKTFNANLVHEPAHIKNLSGGQFKVFTPFWKHMSAKPIAPPLPIPPSPNVQFATTDNRDQDQTIDDLGLLPAALDWAAQWGSVHNVGEQPAQRQLEDRLSIIFEGYQDQRNLPGTEGTSRLSAALRFGQISPRQVWHKTLTTLEHHNLHPSQAANGNEPANAWAFLREIGWREFSHYLLYHFPDLQARNWRATFDGFPWRNDHANITAWQQGRTGYPIVDAGMRELWQTGWMHGRVRMITASFLIKHLMVDWRIGERWFWDTLVDACPANNPASWQWVAGSGADASPYFRIFNPVTQAQKFDTDGDYIRRWVPELAGLDNNSIHQPWTAPPIMLANAGIVLGRTYPQPIVDHKSARQDALAAYDTIKQRAA